MVYIWVTILLALPFIECLCLDCDNIHADCINCNESSSGNSSDHPCLDEFEYFSASSHTFDLSVYASIYLKQFWNPNFRRTKLVLRSELPVYVNGLIKPITLFQVIQV